MPKSLLLFLGVALLISSCGHPKQFKSCDDMASSLKYVMYSDLVKEWGEPTTSKSDLSTYYITWRGVGVNGVDKTIMFKLDYLTNTTVSEPFQFEGVDCDSNPGTTPIATTPSTSQENNQTSNTPVSTEKVDTIISHAPITSLSQLPDPTKIMADKKTRIFFVSKLDDTSLYSWYEKYNNAQLLNATDKEGSAFMSMPFEGQPEAIFLTIKPMLGNDMELQFEYNGK